MSSEEAKRKALALVMQMLEDGETSFREIWSLPGRKERIKVGVVVEDQDNLRLDRSFDYVEKSAPLSLMTSGRCDYCGK